MRVQLRRRRAPGSASAGWAAFLSAAIALVSLLTAPQSVVADQGIGWAIGPSAIIDPEFADDTQVGPGITGEVEAKAGDLLSYAAVISLARTDFPVGTDDLHRNFGSVAIGPRLMRDGELPSFGLFLGIGALFWDDVSETDPEFRSSANAEEMLLAGVELRWPFGDGLGVSFSLRDQLTGWWNVILDPSEGRLNHRFLISAGLYHW